MTSRLRVALTAVTVTLTAFLAWGALAQDDSGQSQSLRDKLVQAIEVASQNQLQMA